MCGITLSRANAACHWPPFSHALTAALRVMTFGWRRRCGMNRSRDKAACHWPPFAQALTAALQVMTF
eukprot:10620110-Alexandrium_andersonii.AAC.1